MVLKGRWPGGGGGVIRLAALLPLLNSKVKIESDDPDEPLLKRRWPRWEDPAACSAVTALNSKSESDHTNSKSDDCASNIPTLCQHCARNKK